jgi:tRNA(fMet)-specific endonuclease VapC
LAVLLDTDVVIHLRDGHPWVEEQVATLEPPFFISAVSRVELENGVAGNDGDARRGLLDHALRYLVTLDFATGEIDAYRTIVRRTGFSRRKTADRMTAATALSHALPLVTLNGKDYRDVPGLELVAWSLPA